MEDEHELDYITVSSIWYFSIQNRLRKAEEIVDMLIKQRDDFREQLDKAMKVNDEAMEAIEVYKQAIEKLKAYIEILEPPQMSIDDNGELMVNEN